MRIALVTEIPAPFRIPLFNALDRLPDVELNVLFLAEHDPRRSYHVYREEFAFRDQVLRGRSILFKGRWVVLTTGLGGALYRARPDAIVVGGWNQPASWRAFAYAALHRIPAILWVESTLRDTRVSGRGADVARRAAVRLSSGFLVPGSASAEYVAALGAAPDLIELAPNAVDLDLFGQQVAALSADRTALRKRLGIRGPTFLYVGRLEHEKGPDVLVRAATNVDADVVFAGSGSLEQELRTISTPRIRFLGHLSREDVLEWYAAADALVLPSRSETWGMVLNEGAAAGLPLIASDAAGGAYDLIDEGVNGFVFPSQDADALARAMQSLAENAELRRIARSRSLELSERHHPEAWAEAVERLVRRLGR